jgi:hypothetical protein
VYVVSSDNVSEAYLTTAPFYTWDYTAIFNVGRALHVQNVDDASYDVTLMPLFG